MIDEQRNTWLAERRKGIGGSDAAAVCGQSRWKTPYDVFLDKIGEVESVETLDMRRGKLLEPVVRQMYSDETGLSVKAAPEEIVRSADYPWALASLDGVVVCSPEKVLELKTSRFKTEWGEPWTAEIPREYLFQTQHYLAVTGLAVAHVAVLFGTDFDFSVYEVPADAEFQSLMMQLEEEFWGMVQRREPPLAVNDADLIKRWRYHKPDSGRKASKDELVLCSQLLAVKEYYKKLDELKEALEIEVKRNMEDAEALSWGEETLVTWKTAKAAMRFDAKRFQTEHPDLYAQYVTQSAASRRFLLKGEAKCLQIMKPSLSEKLLGQS